MWGWGQNLTVGVLRLQTVDGFVAFDLEGARMSAGGTRLAPDVSEQEIVELARAMTYKFAVLGDRLGGAKGGVRAHASDPAARADAMARYCAEIRPLVASRKFLTGPDLGTHEEDFAPIRDLAAVPSVISSTVDGVSFEDVVTGFGVAAAAEAALGGLTGRRVAIEGFGKVGGGVAREVVRRGGTVVAVSTVLGAVHDPGGLDVETLWKARRQMGDRCIEALGMAVAPTSALFDAPADVLVPGARTGAVDHLRAARIQAHAVVPAANVPYTAEGLRTLERRGIAAHADFICNAGAVIAYRSRPDAAPAQVLADVEARIRSLMGQAAGHPQGPFAGACEMAERFLATWRGDDLPEGRPLASAPPTFA